MKMNVARLLPRLVLALPLRRARVGHGRRALRPRRATIRDEIDILLERLSQPG
jgi:hypothetical protein